MCNTKTQLTIKTTDGWRPQPIDTCLAPIINALNNNITTESHCCGHNNKLGHI